MSGGRHIAVLVDWGTTSLRIWLYQEDGSVNLLSRTDQGMSNLNTPNEFEKVLECHLQNVENDHLPVVICGMAGARQGWQEANYVEVPADLNSIFKASIKVKNISRDVRILPGVCQREPSSADVMRGEETQLLGALQMGGSKVICMPGTHSKWVHLDRDRISAFNSYMTGELFEFLSKNSTLSFSASGSEMDFSAFAEAVALVAKKPEVVSKELFKIRAAPLLNLKSNAEARGKLSGLLIGLELADASKDLKGPITLVGAGNLAELYKRALRQLEIEVKQIDADEAVCLGLKQAAEYFWGNVSCVTEQDKKAS